MPSFEQIKRFYSLGLWTKTMVRKAVEKGVLTWMEYEEVVGVTTAPTTALISAVITDILICLWASAGSFSMTSIRSLSFLCLAGLPELKEGK